MPELSKEHQVYYTVEILSFLLDFGRKIHWSGNEIATVVSLTKETKSMLKDISSNMSTQELKKKIEKIQKNIEAKRLLLNHRKGIIELLDTLKIKNWIETSSRGRRITDEGKKVTLLEIMGTFGRPIAGMAECVEKHGETDNFLFLCPKIDMGKCFSYRFYKVIVDFLREFYSSVTIEHIADKGWSKKRIRVVPDD